MSNTSRFVVWVHRSPNSLFGAASNPVIRNGALLFFDEEDRAHAECDRLNAHLGTPHVHYAVQLAQASSESSPKAPSHAYAVAPGGDQAVSRSVIES
jgi:hypothetical protein